MKPWTKVVIGLALFVPGVGLWLGPLILEFGLVVLMGVLVALAVVGGVILIATGAHEIYDKHE